jgi:hypothetical protein
MNLRGSFLPLSLREYLEGEVKVFKDCIMHILLYLDVYKPGYNLAVAACCC